MSESTQTPHKADSSVKEQGKEAITGRGIFWAMVPLLLLVTSVSAWLIMVSVAVDDPGFSVEKDYYKKASNYDDQIAQRRINTRLGYRAQLLSFEKQSDQSAELIVQLSDKDNLHLDELKVSADVFPVARGQQHYELQFESLGGGKYRARFEGKRTGLWEVRVRAENEAEGVVFTQVLRGELFAELSLGSAASAPGEHI